MFLGGQLNTYSGDYKHNRKDNAPNHRYSMAYYVDYELFVSLQ